MKYAAKPAKIFRFKSGIKIGVFWLPKNSAWTAALGGKEPPVWARGKSRLVAVKSLRLKVAKKMAKVIAKRLKGE